MNISKCYFIVAILNAHFFKYIFGISCSACVGQLIKLDIAGSCSIALTLQFVLSLTQKLNERQITWVRER